MMKHNNFSKMPLSGSAARVKLKAACITKAPSFKPLKQVDETGVLLAGCDGSEGAVQFYGLVNARITGGTMTRIGADIHIKQAEEAIIILGAATSFYHENPLAVVRQQVYTALRTDYEMPKARHVKDYQPLGAAA
jgi:hypothetical protein